MERGTAQSVHSPQTSPLSAAGQREGFTFKPEVFLPYVSQPAIPGTPSPEARQERVWISGHPTLGTPARPQADLQILSAVQKTPLQHTAVREADIMPVRLIQKIPAFAGEQREEPAAPPQHVERIRRVQENTQATQNKVIINERSAPMQRTIPGAQRIDALESWEIERLTDRVYSRLERRIQSEQAKRGSF